MASLSSTSKREEENPPEFVIQRNLILQKRSSSVLSDSGRDNETSIEKGRENLKGANKRDSSAAALTGPTAASAAPFKGVHPYDEKTSDHSSLRVGEIRPLSVGATIKNKDTRQGEFGRGLTAKNIRNNGVGVSAGVGREGNVVIMGEDYNSESSGGFVKPIMKSATASSDSGSDVSSVVNGEIIFEDRKKMTNGSSLDSNLPPETEFSYGPGFVDKLKSRFISLSLSNKVKNGGQSLRRFSSLENVLDDDIETEYPVVRGTNLHHPRNSTADVIAKRKRPIGTTAPALNNSGGYGPAAWNRFNKNISSPRNKIGGFKRAKSMETLSLAESERRKLGPTRTTLPNQQRRNQRPVSMIDTNMPGLTLGLINENLVIIESPSKESCPAPKDHNAINNNSRTPNNNKDKSNAAAAVTTTTTNNAALNRQVSSISDEELPKPDIVKNCKLIFETVSKNDANNVVVNNTRATTVPRCAKNAINNKNTSSNGGVSTLPTRSLNRSAKEENQITQSKLNATNRDVPRPNNLAVVAPRTNERVEIVQESKDSVAVAASGESAGNDAGNTTPTSVTNGIELKSPTSVVKEVATPVITPSRQSFKPIQRDELSESLSSKDITAISPVETPAPSTNSIAVSNGGPAAPNGQVISRVARPPSLLNASGKISDAEKIVSFNLPRSQTSKSGGGENDYFLREGGGESEPNSRLNNNLNGNEPASESSVGLDTSYSATPTTTTSLSAARRDLAKESLEKEGPETNGVAINDEDVLKPSAMLNKKPGLWQKAPPTSTTIVYDFRGKDVKSHLPSNPAPFGCAPARINKKKGGGQRQKRRVEGLTLKNGVRLGDADHLGGESNDYSDDDEDDNFDETDVGAHLPDKSGINFVGENAKCTRSSLLTTRNKKLKIQFDDLATSTFEYPSEDWIYEETTSVGLLSSTVNLPETVLSPDNLRPRPSTDNASTDPTTPETDTTTTPLRNNPILNSTGGLSNYTPSMLSSSESSFQLGVSRMTKEDAGANSESTSDAKSSSSVGDNQEEELLPADPDQTSSWSSSTSTSDLLF